MAATHVVELTADGTLPFKGVAQMLAVFVVIDHRESFGRTFDGPEGRTTTPDAGERLVVRSRG
jgi:hypothetical protein